MDETLRKKLYNIDNDMNDDKEYLLGIEDKELKRNLLPSIGSKTNLVNGVDCNKSTRSTSDKSTPLFTKKNPSSKDINKDFNLVFNKTPNPTSMEKPLSNSNSLSRSLNPIKNKDGSFKSPINGLFSSSDQITTEIKLEEEMIKNSNNKMLFSSNFVQKMKSFKETDNIAVEKNFLNSNNKLVIPKKLESNREVNLFSKKSGAIGVQGLGSNVSSNGKKKVLNENFVSKLKVTSVNLCKNDEEITGLLSLCRINQDTLVESLFLDHVFLYKLEKLFGKDATTVTKQKKEKFLKDEVKSALEYYSIDVKYKLTSMQLNKDINDHASFIKNFDFFAK